jgi:hypothetical protein
VASAAAVLVLVQLAFRAWATFGGWFYGDDLKFLSQAASEPLTLEYLFTRHQQQLMPAGVLVSWLVGQGPAFSWSLAALSILLMQALSDAACIYMLIRLFGWRPGVLIPLAFYLYCPLTLGAFMWWAAALNQLPLQAAFFAAIACHVTYARTRRFRWILLSALLLTIALLFYVKSVVMVPLLVMLTLAYLVDGTFVTRLRRTVTRFWLAWILYAAIGVGYLAAYATHGGAPVSVDGKPNYLRTADVQVRETLGPALIGGPWRWLNQGRQDVLADTPEAAVTLAWVILAGIVALTCWRRAGAWKAWAILAVYLVPTVYLTASGRTTLFGADVGRYLRYLSDVSVVACLVLALALMPLRDTPQPEHRRTDPALPLAPAALVLAIAVFIGSVWSSVSYVRFWHADSPAERFVRAASADLAPLDGVDIADEPVPPEFVLAPNAPFDRPTRLLRPLNKHLRSVSTGTDLKAFGRDGHLSPAVVTPGVSAQIPEGSDCGALVTGAAPKILQLNERVTDDRSWLSLAYLASRDGEVRLTIDGSARTLPVLEGPHTLFLRTSGSFTSVSVQSTSGALGLCIDKLVVGYLGTFN